MAIKTMLEITAFFLIVVLITKPMGVYIYRALNGQRTFMSPALGWLEKLLYRISGINAEGEQTWFEYAAALLIFHLFGFILLFVILLLQGLLPLNPQKFPGVEPILALNTAISFLTNTNWQAYTPETTMSYFSQMAGLAVHNFLSASAAICAAAAFMRAFARKETGTIGNFWADMVRTTIYILLPAAVIAAVFLIWQGVPQNFQAYINASQLEGGTQVIAQGPAASQEAIKMLGTNGGGFLNANSAHPYENPTPLSNMIEMLLMIMIPAGLIYSFGLFVNDRKQGWTLFGAVMTILIAFTFITAFQESRSNPLIARAYGGSLAIAGQNSAPYGNLEGKETRFGIGQSAIFSMLTTSISCGAVNNMHDSDMPITGLLELFNMHLGEIIFGGTGSGLYVLLLFALLTVFIAGLMVGRTPEFMGKKIGPEDIQLASAGVLFPSIIILLLTAITVFVPEALKSVSNPGAHGFSQILYAYTSTAANNGSAFAGLNANTLYWNLTLAFNMLLGRLVPMVVVLKLSGNIAAKKTTPVSSGTLPTNDFLFAVLLAAVIIIIGGLTFLPALAIGPLAEHMFLFH